MRRPENLGIAAVGVDHVCKVTHQANSTIHLIDQKEDVGIDAYIELTLDEETTGCLIAAQIKSGNSYCCSNDWNVPADAKHVEYWRSLSLPVCGIVYNPSMDTTRWVDISTFLADRPTFESGNIPVPEGNSYTCESFPSFREHFMDCRDEYATDAYFGRSLRLLSRQDEIEKCNSALWALFSFHRNRPETWFYLILSLPSFRDHPFLLRSLVNVLCHIPGHGDIFWVPKKNIISPETEALAKDMLRHFLSRESLVTLLSAVDGNGYERGSMGQSVEAVASLMPHLSDTLESIVFDKTLSEDLHFWAVLMLVFREQRHDKERAIRILNAAKHSFTDDNVDRVAGLVECLKAGNFID